MACVVTSLIHNTRVNRSLPFRVKNFSGKYKYYSSQNYLQEDRMDRTLTELKPATHRPGRIFLKDKIAISNNLKSSIGAVTVVKLYDINFYK